MRTKFLLALAAVVIAGGAFLAGVVADRYVVSRFWPSGPRSVHEARTEAFKDFLDGKTVKLKGSADTPDAEGAPHTIRKSEIEAVGWVDNAGWSQDGTSAKANLILKTSRGRYAVVGWVQLVDVGGKPAFLGFQPTATAEQ
jgi:hypothetical protein